MKRHVVSTHLLAPTASYARGKSLQAAKIPTLRLLRDGNDGRAGGGGWARLLLPPLPGTCFSCSPLAFPMTVCSSCCSAQLLSTKQWDCTILPGTLRHPALLATPALGHPGLLLPPPGVPALTGTCGSTSPSEKLWLQQEKVTGAAPRLFPFPCWLWEASRPTRNGALWWLLLSRMFPF